MARRYHEEKEMEKSECKSMFISGDSELPLNGRINFIFYTLKITCYFRKRLLVLEKMSMETIL